jgi:hypothetical protein
MMYEFKPVDHPGFWRVFLNGVDMGYTRDPVHYGSGKRARLIYMRSVK